MPRAIRPQHLVSLQAALADNLRVLIDGHYQSVRTLDGRIDALAKDSGIGRNTIYRMLDPEAEAEDGIFRYPRLDNIAKAARVFGVSTPQLLTPDFASQHLAGHKEDPPRPKKRRTSDLRQ